MHRIQAVADFVPPFFKEIWGVTIYAIHWPPETAKTCNTPMQGPPDSDFPGNVPLDALSRSLSSDVFDQFAMSIAGGRSRIGVSPFTSKFDYAIAHPGQQVLTADEQMGWELFDGKGKCNLCHLDSLTAFQQGQPTVNPSDVPETEPYFHDFCAFNLGLPKNDNLAFLYGLKPDRYGVTVNPQGLSVVDGDLAISYEMQWEWGRSTLIITG